MKRSKEQLTDEIIGEAALSLLREKGPINKQSLILRLRAMEAKESDGRRSQAIAYVIAQMSSNNMASLRHEKVREEMDWDRENVYPIFGDSQQSGTTKKH